MSNSIIDVQDFHKSYGKVEAVRGISFSVKPGSLFAFLGPNGAGKSTTIDTLCTLNSYTQGTISISGMDLKKKQSEIRKRIGVVFQDGVLDKLLSVKDNLTYRAGFYFRDSKEIKKAIAFAVDSTNTQELLSRPYGQLSGGQRRRVDIARALLNTPEILFLDEPTTGLDPQTRKHIWDTILRLKKQNNMTVFLTTHYMEEAEQSDDVVIIDEGRIVAHDTPYNLKNQYSNEYLYIKAKKRNEVIQYIKKHNYQWSDGEIICVSLNRTMDALPLLNQIENAIDSIELRYGTMDDVFMNITGKDLRE